jgi:hypothetical protein
MEGNMERTYPHSVFAMVIVLSDLGHLPIDLCQDCRNALLGSAGSHNSLVRYQRHENDKITIVVTRLELNSPKKSGFNFTRSRRNTERRTIALV